MVNIVIDGGKTAFDSEYLQIERDSEITQKRYQPAANKARHEAVKQSNQASRKAHFVADEVLTEQFQIRTDFLAAFQNQDVCSGENSQPEKRSERDAERDLVEFSQRLNYQFVGCGGADSVSCFVSHCSRSQNYLR